MRQSIGHQNLVRAVATAPVGRTAETRQRVLVLIADNPGIKGAAVCTLMGLHPSYVRRLIGDLVAEGLIASSGRGRASNGYRVTEYGAKRAG